MFKKVIVGVDFSDKTDRAIGVALNLAQSTHGTTGLLHVLPPVADEARRTTPGSDTETDAMRAVEDRLRDEAAKLARDHGAQVDYGVVSGKPADEILAYVQKWGGDVIIVASEARKGLDRLILGSVAERLIQLSPVPVLVVGPNAL